MKLAELTVTGFADIVSSDAPAPGGGSCAALYGAIGAALTAMVGGLTQGRKKYAEYAEHAAEVEAKGNELKTRLLDVMDRDTDAFNVVSASFGMPKDTDEQKADQKHAERCKRHDAVFPDIIEALPDEIPKTTELQFLRLQSLRRIQPRPR